MKTHFGALTTATLDNQISGLGQSLMSALVWRICMLCLSEQHSPILGGISWFPDQSWCLGLNRLLKWGLLRQSLVNSFFFLGNAVWTWMHDVFYSSGHLGNPCLDYNQLQSIISGIMGFYTFILWKHTIYTVYASHLFNLCLLNFVKVCLWVVCTNAAILKRVTLAQSQSKDWWLQTWGFDWHPTVHLD